MLLVHPRLWLTPQSAGSAGPQQIWYMNVVPKAVVVTMPAPRFVMSVSAGPLVSPSMMQMHAVSPFPAFESLDEVLEKLNRKLKVEPLPGEVNAKKLGDLIPD